MGIIDATTPDLLRIGDGGRLRNQPARATQTIDLRDVPEKIMKIAREKLPDVNFDNALMKPSGTYEVRGKNKSGKLREIDIRPDGTVEEIE